MRQKQPALVVTFSTTSEAMAAEKYSGEQGLPGRLIPVPREITAGCGLAWCAAPEKKEELQELAEKQSLLYEEMTELFY